MPSEESDDLFILREYVNSFDYFYSDAEFILSLASDSALARSQAARLCRAAILLFVFSLEGLINRALQHFLPARQKEFFLDREKSFSLEDKWRLLPLLVSELEPPEFDYSAYPWSHFIELIQVRNEWVHPKHNWPAYTKAVTSHRFVNLSWSEIPADSGIREKDLVFRQTMIPRNPRSIFVDDVQRAKKVVDDVISELDRLLSGKLTAGQWLLSSQLRLIHPPGATLQDLPRDPDPPKP